VEKEREKDRENIRSRLTTARDRGWHVKSETENGRGAAAVEEDAEEDEKRKGKGNLPRTRFSRSGESRDSKKRRPAEKRLDSNLRPAANEGMGSSPSVPVLSLFFCLSLSVRHYGPVLAISSREGPDEGS